MAAHAARRLLRMNQNLASILGVELLCAARGIEFRAPLVTSQPLQDAIGLLRQHVSSLGTDRYMANDMQAATELVADGRLTDTCPGNCLPQLHDLVAS